MEENYKYSEEDKKALIRFICSMIPFGLKMEVKLVYGDNGHREGTFLGELDTCDENGFCEVTYYDGDNQDWARDWNFSINEVKPYLREMSDITEEEKKECKTYLNSIEGQLIGNEGRMAWYFDYCKEHHLDYNGFIKRNLAKKALPEMYN